MDLYFYLNNKILTYRLLPVLTLLLNNYTYVIKIHCDVFLIVIRTVIKVLF